MSPKIFELLAEALGLENWTAVTVDDHEGESTLQYFLCEDPATAALVLVLPQITAADATHLGQLIMGAAQVEASTVVWVTAEFSPETVQTMAWLAQIARPHCSLEGVEVELWRIGKKRHGRKFSLPGDRRCLGGGR